MTSRLRLFDLTLESDVAFPELEPSPALEADLFLSDGSGTNPPAPRAWVQQVRLTSVDAPWLRVARSGAGFILEFPDRLTLTYDPPGIRCWRAAALTDETFRHLLLNQAMPLIVTQTRRLVLHAACVTREGRTLALAGPAGAGKSTLAAALQLRGWSLNGDDAVSLRPEASGIAAHPAYQGVRLWPDARLALGLASDDAVEGGKQHVRTPGSVRETGALAAVCVLESPAGQAGVRLRRLSGRAALMVLVRNAFTLDPLERSAATSHLRALSAVVAAAPVFELSMRRDPTVFDEVDQLLTERVLSPVVPR